jgi:hypothetical protein
MKNIHVLPTTQPSRLVKIKDTFFITSSVDIPGGTFYNIYITSDEEIRKNDYYIHNNRIGQSAGGEQEKGDYKNCKKIILTTDKRLIADGVQAIEDEFLGWFVKNPTCESIDVVTHYPTIDDEGDNSLSKQYYTINIPQEEPKQETLEYGLLQHIKFCLECGNEAQAIRLIEKYGFEKQEQDKKMYSEEDMKRCWQEATEDMRKQFSTSYSGTTFEKFIEQFNNK